MAKLNCSQLVFKWQRPADAFVDVVIEGDLQVWHLHADVDRLGTHRASTRAGTVCFRTGKLLYAFYHYQATAGSSRWFVIYAHKSSAV